MDPAAERLIEEIYDAVAFPERWEAVVRHVCEAAGATAGLLFTHGGPAEARLLWARHGLADRLLADYLEHFRDRDPWTNVARARGLLDRRVVRRSEELVDDEEFRQSAIFNELLEEHGIGRLCAATLSDGAELAPLQPVFSLYRPADAPPFGEDAARLLERCTPHLQRAIRLRVRLLARGGTGAAWGPPLLDHLPVGAFLLDGEQRVVHANALGRALLDQHDGLRLQRGALSAESGSEARRLHHALAAAATGRGGAADVRVSRPSGRASYVLTILPLSPEAAEPLGGAMVRAVVYAADPAAEPQGLEARLGALFGLTPAECRLVADLLQDLAPGESAARRGVAVSTVRSQLRSVFAKTGTTRQSELLNLVNRCLLLPGGAR